MVRTQIYITEQQRAELTNISQAVGKKQSELIREAIDQLIARFGNRQREAVLNATAGMWKHRIDLPDFEASRKTWDRQ